MNKYTDQEFTYRQVPVSYDGIAKLDSIKGNTVAWNQLAKPLNSTNYGSVRATATYSNDVCTITTTSANTICGIYISSANFGAVIGHKYLFMCTVNPSITRTFRLGLDSITTTADELSVTANKDNLLSIVQTATTSDAFVLYLRCNAVGDTATIKNVIAIDLTLLGMDDVTDKASFQKYFSLPYYSYNSGTLVNFNGNGIKTVGKNQLNAEDVGTGASGVTFTTNVGSFRQVYSGTSVYIDARFYASSPYANGHFLPTKYTLSFDVSGVPNGQRWTYGLRGTNNAFIIGQSATFDADGHYKLTVDFENVADCHISFCRVTGATPFDITVSNLQFELGTTETEYEPYQEVTTNLPVSSYFPNGLKSAGSVYDELTPSKAVTRIGTATISGGITSKDSQDKLFLLPSVSGIKSVAYTDVPNITSRFEAKNLTNARSSTVNAICQNGTSIYISLAGQSITTIADANTYLASNPLVFNYELATPTEADATDIFFKFYGDGTEEVLPTNGSTPTTSAFFGDITYYNTFEGEVPYRKFWMVNSKGERWNLTEREVKSFLNNPQGFGFAKTISTTRYGNAQVLTDITDNFPSPSGEVLFYDSHNSTRYEQYNEFVKFLSYEPVTLYYKLPFSFYSQIPNVYTLECVVGTLTKTESKNDNLMTCPITFNALSYYKGDEVNINGTGTSYTITNDGDFPVGFEITLQGSLTNPYITLEQNGDLYGEAKFDDETAFSSVYVNSNDGEQNVVLEQGGSILPNPLSYQDLSISNGSIYVTFVKLARGESTLTIGMDSGSLTSATIKFAPIYRSV